MIDIELSRFDQRCEVRYKTSIQAKVWLEKGEPLSALITNISRSGLQLSGGHRLIQQLMPRQVSHRPTESIPVRISCFVSTTEGEKEVVDLTCQVVYAKRKAMDMFLIGCRFSHFHGNSEAALQDFLQHFAERE